METGNRNGAASGRGVVVDIVGHEKPNITFAVYSGGASLKTKAEAVERVRYPLGRVKIV
jgi:hypothetical protein